MNAADSTPSAGRAGVASGTADAAVDDAAVDDAAEIARLAALVSTLQDTRVEEWVRLVRFGSVIPLGVESSLSWRLTRPLRLGQTAIGVLRRDGANRFWAAVRVRLKRLVARG